MVKTKKCIYCNKEFLEWDFPQTFHRQLTCGSVECAGKRRRELWNKNNGKKIR